LITAIDSNVLLDFFGSDPTFGASSSEAIRRSLAEGSLIACEVVWAEVASFFPSSEKAKEVIEQLGVAFSSLELEATLLVGQTWREYRKRGGKRERVIADFLIGAHATFQAERLLTRDRGFYRTYFSNLKVLDPTQE
jgi:predicted nucleic acid-binding protein